MGKKGNLLTESQVRQFMKLANLEPLTPGFVQGLREAAPVGDDDIDWDAPGPGQAPPVGSVGAPPETAVVPPKPSPEVEDVAPVVAKKVSPATTKARASVAKMHQAKRARVEKLEAGRMFQAEHGRHPQPDEEAGALEAFKDKAKRSAATSAAVKAMSDAEKKKALGGQQNESHGRGRGEGAAGYGKPDDNGRAGARLREQLPPGEEDLDPLDELPPEDPLDELPLEGEEDLEGLEGLEGGGREVSVDDFLAALEVALEDVLGDEVEVEQDDEEEELDLGPEEEPLPPEGELPPGEEELPLQEMINTITKRVAKRIVREALQKRK